MARKTEQEVHQREKKRTLEKLSTPQNRNGEVVSYYYLETTDQFPINLIDGSLDRSKKKFLFDKRQDILNMDKPTLRKSFINDKADCQKRIDELQVFIDQLDNE